MRPLTSLFLLLCICILNNDSFAKVAKKNESYYDDGALHRQITAIEPSIKEATYFAIAAQTDLSVNTNSSAVINAYNDMRKVSATTPIYFVLNNNGGIAAKDMDWYLQHVFRLPLHSDSNLHVIENEQLYQLLHYGGSPAKNYYIFNTLLAYKESGKYSLIGDAVLPKHKYQLIESKSVQLQSDTVRLSYLDYFKPMSGNEMLFLTDIQNMVVVFDLNTGKITKRFAPKMSGVDYYCDLIAKTQAECDTARKYNSILEGLNRKNYYIFNIEHDSEHVYLSAGIQVIVRLKKQLTFDNDEGGKDKYVVDSGKIFGYGFNILAVLDHDLNLQHHYMIPDDIIPEKDGILCTECAFMFIDSNRLISSVTPDKKTTPLLAELSIDGKKLSFEKYLPTMGSKHFYKTGDYNTFNYLCSFNGANLMVTDINDGIYDTRYTEPVSILQGDGTIPIKEHLPKYYEESEDIRLNFQPTGMSTNGKKLYILYKYKNDYLLEIKNKKYRTVEVLNLSGIKGIDQIPEVGSSENITLYKDKVYIKYLYKGDYYMTIYDIKRINES